MLSRLKTRIQSLSVLLRERWTRLGRRRQVAVGVVGALVVAGGVSAAVVLGLSGGGLPSCDKPLCAEVIGPMGDAVQPMTPVRIRLAGDLNRKAAVEALQISNQPAGDKRFEGDVLTFRPEWPGFARGVSYDVALALPASELPAGAEPVDMSFRFTTDGKLEVSSVFPEDGTQEVALDAGIMVQFNRSVAPLTVIDERGPQGIIEFDPPVAGEGRWLNTSLYTFTPAAGGWAPAARLHSHRQSRAGQPVGGRARKGLRLLVHHRLPEGVDLLPAGQHQVRRARRGDQGRLQPAGGPALRRGRLLAGSPRARRTRSPAASSGWTTGRSSSTRRSRSPSPPRSRRRFAPASGPATPPPRQPRTCAGRSPASGCLTLPPPTPQNGNQHAERNGVRITFTNPMDQKSVEDHIVITPKPDSDPYMSWEMTGLNLYLGFDDAALVRLSRHPEHRRQGPLRPAPRRAAGPELRDDRMQPGFSIFRSSRSGTFNVYLDPTIFVSSWNLERLDFELYRIDRNGLIATERQSYGSYSPPPTGLIRKWSESIQNPPLDQPTLTSTRLAADRLEAAGRDLLPARLRTGRHGLRRDGHRRQQRERRQQVDAARPAGLDGGHVDRRADSRAALPGPGLRRQRRRQRHDRRRRAGSHQRAGTTWRRLLLRLLHIGGARRADDPCGHRLERRHQPLELQLRHELRVHAAGPRRLPVHRPAHLPPRRDGVLEGRRARGRRRALLDSLRSHACPHDSRRAGPGGEQPVCRPLGHGHLRYGAGPQLRGVDRHVLRLTDAGRALARRLPPGRGLRLLPGGGVPQA